MSGEVRDGAHDPSGDVGGQIRDSGDVGEQDEEEVVDEERCDRDERVAHQAREHAPRIGQCPKLGGRVAVEVNRPDLHRVDPRERVHGEDEHVHFRLVPTRPHVVVHSSSERLGKQPHAGLGILDGGSHLEAEEGGRDAISDPALHRHGPCVAPLSKGEVHVPAFGEERPELGDILRIVLSVAVHRQDVVAGLHSVEAVPDAGHQREALSAVSRMREQRDAGVMRATLQVGPVLGVAAVIDDHDRIGVTLCPLDYVNDDLARVVGGHDHMNGGHRCSALDRRGDGFARTARSS